MTELKTRGVELRLEQDRVKYRPVDKVTDLLEAMRQHKGLIRATLLLEQLIDRYKWLRIEYQPPNQLTSSYPLEVSEILSAKSLPRIAKDLADVPSWSAYHPCTELVYSFTGRTLN